MLPVFRPKISFLDLFGGITERTGTLPVLEESFQASLNIPHSVYFPSVSSAVQAFIESQRLASLEDVVLSAYTSSDFGFAIHESGLKPLYVDIGEGFNADPIQFRAALSSRTAGFGIVSSTWGTELDAAFLAPFDKPVLFDLSGRILSGERFALFPNQAALFQLDLQQPITAVKGVMLCTESRKQAIQWREWRDRQPYFESNARSWWEACATYANHQFRSVPRAYYPGAWAYALGIRQLADRARIAGERRAQVKRYHTALGRQKKNVELPQGAVLSHYPVCLNHPGAVAKFLRENGIGTQSGSFSNLAIDQPATKGRFWREPLLVRQRIKETIFLPLYSGLSESDQKRIASTLSSWKEVDPLPRGSISCYLPSE